MSHHTLVPSLLLGAHFHQPGLHGCEDFTGHAPLGGSGRSSLHPGDPGWALRMKGSGPHSSAISSFCLGSPPGPPPYKDGPQRLPGNTNSQEAQDRRPQDVPMSSPFPSHFSALQGSLGSSGQTSLPCSALKLSHSQPCSASSSCCSGKHQNPPG